MVQKLNDMSFLKKEKKPKFKERIFFVFHSLMDGCIVASLDYDEN